MPRRKFFGVGKGPTGTEGKDFLIDLHLKLLYLDRSSPTKGQRLLRHHHDNHKMMMMMMIVSRYATYIKLQIKR